MSAAPSIAHDLYERYSGQIYGFCVNRLGSREDAEDALQSTFLNAHRALQRGVTPDAELPWLFTIAHNVCLTRRRSTRRRGRVEAPSDLEAVQEVIPSPPRDRPEELMSLPGALADMPDNQRRAILLREWKGLSYHEIADELEMSQSAVETLIFRARRTLAANLEAEPRTGLLARARQALDLGGLVAAVKTLFEGAFAVKATAAAVAVSSAVVVAQAPSDRPRPLGAVPPAVGAKTVAPPVREVGGERSLPTAPAVTAPPAAAPDRGQQKPAVARTRTRAPARGAAATQPPAVETAQPIAPQTGAPSEPQAPPVGVRTGHPQVEKDSAAPEPDATPQPVAMRSPRLPRHQPTAPVGGVAPPSEHTDAGAQPPSPAAPEPTQDTGGVVAPPSTGVGG